MINRLMPINGRSKIRDITLWMEKNFQGNLKLGFLKGKHATVEFSGATGVPKVIVSNGDENIHKI